MLTIRSLLFNAFLLSSSLAYGAAVLLLFGVPRRIHWAFCVSWCRLAVWAGDFFCGLHVVVEGRENIPKEPSVIMIKHTTALETYWHVTEFPRTSWVVKRELLWIPLFGWAIGILFKPIAINRKAGGSAVRQVIEQGEARLREGLWVTIFPEGTRMPAGETRRYGASGAALAINAGVKIVPVAHNAGDFWPRRGFLKRPGTVRFRIGKPIDPSGKTVKEVNAIVQDWIETTMLDISAVYQDKMEKTV
jgi:1-acyl-sn-glycerol-3-phosphate acyltransferase